MIKKIFLPIFLFILFLAVSYYAYLLFVFGAPAIESKLVLNLIPKDPKATTWVKEVKTTGLFTDEGYITVNTTGTKDELVYFYSKTPVQWGWKQTRNDCKQEMDTTQCLFTFTRKLLFYEYMLIIPLRSTEKQPVTNIEIKVLKIQQ